MKLKKQKVGQQPNSYCSPSLTTRNLSQKRRPAEVADYIAGRSNGIAADNPKWAFPEDGDYEWVRWQKGEPQPTPYGHSSSSYSFITYREGPKDKEWMAEKDRNYISRLRHEDPETLKALVENDEVAAAIFKSLEIASIKQYVEEDSLNKVKTFYSNKRNFPIIDAEGTTPLHWAAGGGQTEILKWLLSNQKINTNAPSSRGLTPMHMAILNGQVLSLRLLLSAGDINLEAKTRADYQQSATGLHLAAMVGNVSILNHLLNVKVDSAATNQLGQTALHLAAFHGKLAAMRALLTRSPELRNEVDNKMQTALHAAVVGNQEQAIGVLLDAGLYPGLKDKDGLTAEELAEKLGHIKLVQYFQQREHDQKNRPAQFDMQAMFAQFQQFMLAQQAPTPSEYAGSIHSMSDIGSSIGDRQADTMRRFFESMQHPPSTSNVSPAVGGAVEMDTPPSSGPASPR